MMETLSNLSRLGNVTAFGNCAFDLIAALMHKPQYYYTEASARHLSPHSVHSSLCIAACSCGPDGIRLSQNCFIERYERTLKGRMDGIEAGGMLRGLLRRCGACKRDFYWDILETHNERTSPIKRHGECVDPYTILFTKAAGIIRQLSNSTPLEKYGWPDRTGNLRTLSEIYIHVKF